MTAPKIPAPAAPQLPSPQPGRVTRHVTFEDPSLPHQIVITLRGGGPRIAVSCNCLRLNGYGTRGAYEPIETRTRWEAAEAMAVWRAHLPAAEDAS